MVQNTLCLVFTVEQELYGLPVEVVDTVLRSVACIPPPPSERKLFTGYLNRAGSILPIVNLRTILGLGEKDIGIDDRMIVFGNPRSRLVLVAQSIHDLVPFPLENLELLQESRELLLALFDIAGTAVKILNPLYLERLVRPTPDSHVQHDGGVAG